MNDLRNALRSLLKQPGFAAVVVVTLALGIGASTAIFSVVNAVLLRPLPFPHAERLQVVWGNYRTLNIERLPAKAAEYEDYAKQTEVFDTVAAYANHSFNVTTGAEPERVRGAYVSATLFSMLEAQPAAGRVFTSDEQQPGRDRVVVLSDGYWRRRFAGDRGVINLSVTLDNESYTVIGVMPPGFQFPHPSFSRGEPADVWAPLTYTPDQVTKRSGPYFLNVLARLKPGVTLEQSRAHMTALGQRFERELRGYRGPKGEDGGWQITVTSLQEEIVGGSRRALLVLLFAVGLLLLIACSNVANLSMMRSAKRHKELAIRAALGASRWRIAKQLLVEGLVLATVAAVLGLLFVNWGIDLLFALGPSIVPRAQEVSIDGRVFAFLAVTVALISIAFGLVAARPVSKLDLNESLKSTRPAGGVQRRQWSNALVVAEVSLAVLLLVGSGLLAKSLWRLQQTNPGITPEDLVSVEFDLSATTYGDAERASDFYRRLVTHVQTLPGVESASFGTNQPLSGTAGSDPFAIEGRQLDPTNLTAAGWQLVGANYLKTLGITLVKGRDFTPEDMQPGAAPVAVINERMAARYWPNEDPVGRRITLGLPRPDNPWVTIIGIAKDVPHRAVDSKPEPDWYTSRVVAPQRHRYVFVRSALPSATLTAAIRNSVAAIDPNQPLTSVKTMQDVISTTTAPRRFSALLLGVFAAIALVLATLGIYSVISYSITLRTQEIGIRMALGARRPTILLMVLRKGMVLTLIGVAIGLAGAFVLTRWISSLLFGVSASDPVTYAIVLLVALGAALLACSIPASRATRVDPLVALRYE
ncbi:MAG TPA: ABC transporter permease [Pyrinomonadaceae bacterium]|nr:ABC transporter permease [Pyrinomonadaceae bacterium]